MRAQGNVLILPVVELRFKLAPSVFPEAHRCTRIFQHVKGYSYGHHPAVPLPVALRPTVHRVAIQEAGASGWDLEPEIAKAPHHPN